MSSVLDIKPAVGSEQDAKRDLPIPFPALSPKQEAVDPGKAGLASQLLQIVSKIIAAASRTLRTRWFWYSIASSLCWTAWAFTAKLGSKEIPPATMQFVSAFGFLLVVILLFVVKNLRLRSSFRGGCYALVSGVLLGLGGMALYAAYRSHANASVVTATTSLYPVATAIFAVTFLRERLNKLQVLGIFFAAAAILLLSS